MSELKKIFSLGKLPELIWTQPIIFRTDGLLNFHSRKTALIIAIVNTDPAHYFHKDDLNSLMWDQ